MQRWWLIVLEHRCKAGGDVSVRCGGAKTGGKRDLCWRDEVYRSNSWRKGGSLVARGGAGGR